MPSLLESCHMTIVGGYVVEGHVPAEDVKKLLAAKPAGISDLRFQGCPRARRAWT